MPVRLFTWKSYDALSVCFFHKVADFIAQMLPLFFLFLRLCSTCLRGSALPGHTPETGADTGFALPHFTHRTRRSVACSSA